MLINIKDVWHVGTLDKNKKSSFSLEGDLLSVSQLPLTWNKLARANGINNRLRLNSALYVDYYKFKTENYNSVIDWALEQNFIIEAKTYSYSYFDDEMDEELTFTFDTIEELLDEFPDAEESDISFDTQWKLSEIFKSQNFYSSQSNYDLTNLFIKFIELNHLSENQNIVGIWWNDEYDPLRYSAPRGGIFNSQLHLFEIIQEQELFDSDIIDVDAINNIKF